MSEYIGAKLIKGSVWSIASRFSLRGIGLINTIILARLLKPEDFGLIALSMLVVGLVTLFSSTGMGQAILRRKDVNRELLDTAWTLRIIAGVVLSMGIFLLAPFTADYFEDPRIEPVMQLIALQPFLESLNNIGFVLYAKNLEFHKVFYRTLLSKILAVSAVIALAFWLQNYWALAFGMVLQSAITSVMSFIMHPYRPSFCLRAAKELASDSINSVSKNMAIYLKNKADEFFVGTLGGASSLGGYYVAKSVTNMLTAEIVQPAGNALLPGYSRMADDPVRIKKALIKVVQAVALFSFACSVGLFAIAENFINVVFGSEWLHIISYFQIFSLLGGLAALQSVTGPVLIAHGKLKVVTFFTWFNLICFISVLLPIADYGDVLLIAKSILFLNSAMILINYSLLVIYIRISILDIFKALLRPLIAASVMFFTLSYIEQIWLMDMSIINLFIKTFLGAFIYGIVLLFLWIISRRPEGVESLVIYSFIKQRI